jgi:ATP-dependent helicase/nuclease subunit A
MTTLREPGDQAQRAVIERELNRTVLVEAAAGTGKTTSMVRRMVNLLAQGACRIETLAAVTFTRKAAAELRARFQVELEAEAERAERATQRRLTDARDGIEKCFIGTIHSFCARMLRERPVEAGVDVSFTEIEDAADRQLRAQAWHDYVNGLYATHHPILTELNELDIDITDLEESFLSLAEYPDVESWPARALPMPDIGPARQPLAEMVAHMEEIAPRLPETYGRDELIPKYRAIPRMYRQAKQGNRVPEFIQVCAEFKRAGIVQKMWPGGRTQALEELDRYDTFRRDVTEPLVQAWREYCYEPLLRALMPAVAVYDDLRAKAGQLNFQDLLMKAASLLRSRPGVRTYFRRRFKHLLVDEFQDTDPIQAEVMLLLTADDPEEMDWRSCKPVPGSLFVVGDPKQSIYRFRRADIVTYNQVKEIVERTGGMVVHLTTNFRTIEPLIGWVNGTFAERFSEHPPECSPAYVPLEPFRCDVDGSDLSGLRVVRVAKELSRKEEIGEYEADLIARFIRDAVESGLKVPRTEKELDHGVAPEATYGDFLVITKNTKNLSRYSAWLQSYGIPHQITGGSAMNRVSELSLLHTCLRALIEPDNPVALVAVLRSEIFGFSDNELFRFVQAKGTFDFRSRLPEGLEEATDTRLSETFSRLRLHAHWLSVLPPVAAFEKIAADLGLTARAAAGPGGDTQAGSLLKALELIREISKGVSTAGELVDYLRSLVQGEPTFDGISTRLDQESTVRVMNLHKVKGLEAPVVFLADPTGYKDHPPRLHIDRSGQTARGFLPISGGAGQKPPILAQPENWSLYEERERQFQAAEELRLLYVAATRAGAQLTVTLRESRKGSNPWNFFEDRLTDVLPLPEPPVPAPRPGDFVSLSEDDVQDASSRIRQQWDHASTKSYEVSAVKSLTVQRGRPSMSQGEHGVEWGTVIHLLLEAAMKHPEADIERLAQGALAEQGLDAALAEEAVATVRAVVTSDLWLRAARAAKRLVEVPFQKLVESDTADSPGKTVLRGIIDLAFREPPGWVIVDYKSERVPDGRIPDLVEHYAPQVVGYAQAWTEMTGEPIHEIGLYFTHIQRYVPIRSEVANGT